MPFRIGIIVRIVDLFKKAFTSDVEIIGCANSLTGNVKLSTDGFFNLFGNLVEYWNVHYLSIKINLKHIFLI